MRVLVINVQHAKGISAKNNSEYDICTITYGIPMEPVQRDNRQVVGYGYDVRELQLDPSALSDFQDKKLPAVLDVNIEPNPRNVQRNVCMGVNAA